MLSSSSARERTERMPQSDAEKPGKDKIFKSACGFYALMRLNFNCFLSQYSQRNDTYTNGLISTRNMVQGGTSSTIHPALHLRSEYPLRCAVALGRWDALMRDVWIGIQGTGAKVDRLIALNHSTDRCRELCVRASSSSRLACFIDLLLTN